MGQVTYAQFTDRSLNPLEFGADQMGSRPCWPMQTSAVLIPSNSGLIRWELRTFRAPHSTRLNPLEFGADQMGTFRIAAVSWDGVLIPSNSGLIRWGALAAIEAHKARS